MKRRGKRIGSLLVAMCMFFAGASVVSGEEIGEYDLHAKAAVLMDGESGRVLYGKNADMVLPMASTTKIMTCIIALENGVLEEEVTVSAYAASQPKVHLGMRKGERYLLKDLLCSLMLESHNDSAVAIAEHIGGKGMDLPEISVRTAEESKEAVMAFATLMNQKAKELGCENTFFVTPNGLDANAEVTENGKTVVKSHGTTAEELGKIMIYCTWNSPEKQRFLEITRLGSHSFSEVDGKRNVSCVNHNTFLNMKEGALSGKTGFTNAAGYCYVGALEKDGEKYVVALLACGWPSNKSWKWSDTSKLMDYGLVNYENHEREEYESVKERIPKVLVENGQTDGIGEKIYMEPEIVAGPENIDSVLLKQGEEVEIVVDMKEKLQAPVREGEVIGNVQYRIDGNLLWSELIVSPKSVFTIDYKWCFEQILTEFLLK